MRLYVLRGKDYKSADALCYWSCVLSCCWTLIVCLSFLVRSGKSEFTLSFCGFCAASPFSNWIKVGWHAPPTAAWRSGKSNRDPNESQVSLPHVAILTWKWFVQVATSSISRGSYRTNDSITELTLCFFLQRLSRRFATRDFFLGGTRSCFNERQMPSNSRMMVRTYLNLLMILREFVFQQLWVVF